MFVLVHSNLSENVKVSSIMSLLFDVDDVIAITTHRLLQITSRISNTHCTMGINCKFVAGRGGQLLPVEAAGIVLERPWLGSGIPNFKPQWSRHCLLPLAIRCCFEVTMMWPGCFPKFEMGAIWVQCYTFCVPVTCNESKNNTVDSDPRSVLHPCAAIQVLGPIGMLSE